MKQRVGYFDFLRGVAILLVIAIHTYTVDSFDTPIGFVRIVLRQFCNVAVPLFLAISRFFMAKKHILQWQDILPFFRRQLTKIYFPTLIWSIPLLLQFYGQCHDLIKSMIYYVLCGLGVYYFVALILQCYVVTPFIGRLPARSVLLYSAIISCVSISCVTYFVSIKGIHVPLFVYAGPLFVWLVFYVLGFSLYHIERSVFPWKTLSGNVALLPVTCFNFAFYSIKTRDKRSHSTILRFIVGIRSTFFRKRH